MIYKYIDRVYTLATIILAILISSSNIYAKDYIIISEIMYDSPLNEQIATGTAYSNGEFIELYNTGVDSVNLTGWSLKGGGSTEIYNFPVNTVLSPKSYLIVAYQYNNSGFTLEQLYLGFTADSKRQVQYQRKIILSNSGEALKLRDPNGITKDSIYIDGTTNKTKPYRITAENNDGIEGNSCISVHRSTSVFDFEGNAIPNNQEWSVSTIGIYAQTTPFKTPLIPGVHNSEVSSWKNYIISVTPLDPTHQIDIVNGDITLHDEARGNISVQYFDGLGRLVQTIQQSVTPEKPDLVSLTEYDGVGRDYIHWLPTAFAGNNGAFINTTSFKPQAETFYNDLRPFSETKFEFSPLSRIDKQFGVGAAWLNNPTSMKYETNGDDIKYFFVNESGNLQKGVNYKAGALYKTTVLDEDNNPQTEYKDKLGRVVLKQNFDGIDKVNTYSVYNDLGQLSYVIPPKASDELTNDLSDSNSTIQQLCYFYKYDERGNCIEKHLPGCESIYMIYDKANRLILTQDGNQRINNRWIKRMYDNLGRIVYTCEIETETSMSLLVRYFKEKLCVSEFSTENKIAAVPNLGYELYPQEFYSYIKVGTDGYTSIPIEIIFNLKNILIVNYYDNYDFVSITDNNLNYDNSKEQEYGIRYNSTKGLLTGNRTYMLDESGVYSAGVLYYDYQGRAIQTRNSNHLGGYDFTYTQYGFTETVKKTLKEHYITTGTSSNTKELYTYTYDHAGRLKETMYQINDETPIILSENQKYDELGRLEIKKRHGISNNFVDQEKFKYNIRSWTEKIESGTFKEELFYNTNPVNTNLCFNGNISFSTWTYGDGDKYKGYLYTYDKLNRLNFADFKQETSDLENGHYNEAFEYDKMGNITKLSRSIFGSDIDALTLTYNGNQLKNVIDGEGNRNEYNIKEYHSENPADLDISTTEFMYDANGNLNSDVDRGIVTIKYNLLNLPSLVQFKNGSQILNKYDASGLKLSSEYYNCINQTLEPLERNQVYDWTATPWFMEKSSTLYIDNIEYKTENSDWVTPILSRISNSEGYVDNLNISGQSIRYNYYRRDHLGNNREVWHAAYSQWHRNDNPELGYYEVTVPASTIQRTEYYPSGLPLAESSGSIKQPYKYNGKEFVEMHGYDTYDYGARGMYAGIGRFTSLDRFAEKYPWQSPYCYAANNPIRFIDVNGDSIDVSESIYKNFVTNYSLKLYVKSDEGRAFLSNYASKGQTLYGYTFDKAGKYDKLGINLEFTTFFSSDPSQRGQTTYSNDGTITVAVNSLCKVGSQDGKNYDWTNYTTAIQTANQMTHGVISRTITFFHESFIHVNLFTNDFIDNRKFDYSNISPEIKNHANFNGIPNSELHHQQVYWNGNNSLWPGAAYRGIVNVNNAFGQRYNNLQLNKMIWSYYGGRND